MVHECADTNHQTQRGQEPKGRAHSDRRIVETRSMPVTVRRGGMTGRSYHAVYPDRKLRVWTYELPDGKLE